MRSGLLSRARTNETVDVALDSIRSIGDDDAMVVINERSRVPALDEAALERLGHALDHEGVVAAMLIGSQARGTTGPLSDVDIAVWHDPYLDSPGRFDLRDGRRLVERDHDERVRLETRAILEYLDTAPLRAELGRGVRRRIEEGRFGRR